MYGWPKRADSENSPAELAAYRRHYNAELAKALPDEVEWGLNERSHLIEAIWIALLNFQSQLPIIMKFIRAVLGEDINAIGVMVDISKGEFGKGKWEELRDGLRVLILGKSEVGTMHIANIDLEATRVTRQSHFF